MSNYDYDLFVIGAGSGGVRAARMSASYGARVAVAEERFLGGTCVNVGCIPKKLFSYGSHYLHYGQEARAYGWDFAEPTLNWSRLIENKNREIKRLNEIYRNLLKNAGVALFEARAVLIDTHTLDVGGEKVTAEKILVATGGKPSRDEVPGEENALVSDDAFYLKELPKRVLVVGGGYIAVEFAGILNGYGAATSLVYRRDMILRGFDLDVRRHLAAEMEKNGIKFIWNSAIQRIDKVNLGLDVTFSDGSLSQYDQVLYAIGRVANSANMGLENVGVEVSANGAIKVDDYFRTSVENIYALGDLIDRYQLTPVAIGEAMKLASNLFKGTNDKMDYADIPTAVFSDPPIGTVGLTEEDARAQYKDIEIYRSTFRALKDTLTGSSGQTMMKLVVDKTSDRVVGCHMVGPDASEIIQGLGVALKCGATKAQFDATVGIHPTAAEEFVTMREPVPEKESDEGTQ
ncbi:MAG: Glutathione amide reductase [Alphaproteobacteria bacterium MarineAlpha11_Bin1]|nr:MAG: Glutathione amide reductase [Alphaproteobacteria bacterium MarineAlpha11_Bin1]|tara:strand:+ start:5307 stop:6686 length:1380 start_codon:yes stop_codon:yes gene_type:complete